MENDDGSFDSLSSPLITSRSALMLRAQGALLPQKGLPTSQNKNSYWLSLLLSKAAFQTLKNGTILSKSHENLSRVQGNRRNRHHNVASAGKPLEQVSSVLDVSSGALGYAASPLANKLGDEVPQSIGLRGDSSSSSSSSWSSSSSSSSSDGFGNSFGRARIEDRHFSGNMDFSTKAKTIRATFLLIDNAGASKLEQDLLYCLSCFYCCYDFSFRRGYLEHPSKHSSSRKASLSLNPSNDNEDGHDDAEDIYKRVNKTIAKEKGSFLERKRDIVSPNVPLALNKPVVDDDTNSAINGSPSGGARSWNSGSGQSGSRGSRLLGARDEHDIGRDSSEAIKFETDNLIFHCRRCNEFATTRENEDDLSDGGVMPNGFPSLAERLLKESFSKVLDDDERRDEVKESQRYGDILAPRMHNNGSRVKKGIELAKDYYAGLCNATEPERVCSELALELLLLLTSEEDGEPTSSPSPSPSSSTSTSSTRNMSEEVEGHAKLKTSQLVGLLDDPGFGIGSEEEDPVERGRTLLDDYDGDRNRIEPTTTTIDNETRQANAKPAANNHIKLKLQEQRKTVGQEEEEEFKPRELSPDFKVHEDEPSSSGFRLKSRKAAPISVLASTLTEEGGKEANNDSPPPPTQMSQFDGVFVVVAVNSTSSSSVTAGLLQLRLECIPGSGLTNSQKNVEQSGRGERSKVNLQPALSTSGGVVGNGGQFNLPIVRLLNAVCQRREPGPSGVGVGGPSKAGATEKAHTRADKCTDYECCSGFNCFVVRWQEAANCSAKVDLKQTNRDELFQGLYRRIRPTQTGAGPFSKKSDLGRFRRRHRSSSNHDTAAYALCLLLTRARYCEPDTIEARNEVNSGKADKRAGIERRRKRQTKDTHYHIQSNREGLSWRKSLDQQHSAPPLPESTLAPGVGDENLTRERLERKLSSINFEDILSVAESGALENIPSSESEKRFTNQMSSDSSQLKSVVVVKAGCALFDDKPYVIYSALGSFYIPMLIMVFFYSRIYLVASRAQKAMQRGYMTTKWPVINNNATKGANSKSLSNASGGGGRTSISKNNSSSLNYNSSTASFSLNDHNHLNQQQQQHHHHQTNSNNNNTINPSQYNSAYAYGGGGHLGNSGGGGGSQSLANNNHYQSQPERVTLRIHRREKNAVAPTVSLSSQKDEGDKNKTDRRSDTGSQHQTNPMMRCALNLTPNKHGNRQELAQGSSLIKLSVEEHHQQRNKLRLQAREREHHDQRVVVVEEKPIVVEPILEPTQTQSIPTTENVVKVVKEQQVDTAEKSEKEGEIEEKIEELLAADRNKLHDHDHNHNHHHHHHHHHHHKHHHHHRHDHHSRSHHHHHKHHHKRDAQGDSVRLPAATMQSGSISETTRLPLAHESDSAASNHLAAGSSLNSVQITVSCYDDVNFCGQRRGFGEPEVALVIKNTRDNNEDGDLDSIPMIDANLAERSQIVLEPSMINNNNSSLLLNSLLSNRSNSKSDRSKSIDVGHLKSSSGSLPSTKHPSIDHSNRKDNILPICRPDRSNSCEPKPAIVINWNLASNSKDTEQQNRTNVLTNKTDSSLAKSTPALISVSSNDKVKTELIETDQHLRTNSDSQQAQKDQQAGTSSLSMMANIPSQVRKQSMMLLSTLTSRSSQTLRRLSMVASHPVDSLLKRSRSREDDDDDHNDSESGTDSASPASCSYSSRSSDENEDEECSSPHLVGGKELSTNPDRSKSPVKKKRKNRKRNERSRKKEARRKAERKRRTKEKAANNNNGRSSTTPGTASTKKTLDDYLMAVAGIDNSDDDDEEMVVDYDEDDDEDDDDDDDEQLDDGDGFVRPIKAHDRPSSNPNSISYSLLLTVGVGNRLLPGGGYQSSSPRPSSASVGVVGDLRQPEVGPESHSLLGNRKPIMRSYNRVDSTVIDIDMPPTSTFHQPSDVKLKDVVTVEESDAINKREEDEERNHLSSNDNEKKKKPADNTTKPETSNICDQQQNQQHQQMLRPSAGLHRKGGYYERATSRDGNSASFMLNTLNTVATQPDGGGQLQQQLASQADKTTTGELAIAQAACNNNGQQQPAKHRFLLSSLVGRGRAGNGMVKSSLAPPPLGTTDLTIGAGAPVAPAVGGVGAKSPRLAGGRRRGAKQTSRWHAKRLRAETKAAKTVGIIVGGFIFCWLPFFTAYLSRAIVCNKSEDCIPHSLWSLFIWLGYLNSAINPVIYGLFSADFRHAFKNIVCRCRLRNTDDTIVVSALVDSIIKSIL